ncbi:thioredoxin family protein [Candidatus Sumerlaeota bacterium]|nr:thioredoxin family protein [Candidatus Sumerlaeota bacterium]
MAETPSQMMRLDTEAPDFALRNVVDDREIKRDDFRGQRGLLVAFICNHCPFVKIMKDQLSQLGRDLREKDIGMVAICSNDAGNYPDDHPDKMKADAARYGYPFPYLHDENQDVAKAYRAACTPDFFLFDANFKLIYRGQFDDARPGNGLPVSGSDIRMAVNALLGGKPPIDTQKPSIGCNIKWKPGNEPDYYKH